jgi:hypothetical protein
MSATTWSTLNRVGLVLQFVYGLANLPTAFMGNEIASTTPGGEPVGPPMWILWADTLLAVVLVFAVVHAWLQANRASATVASAANILITLTAVPVYFVEGVPEHFKTIETIAIVWTIVSVALTHLRAKA